MKSKTWKLPEPEPETNLWRPIVQGEWPECKPGDEIELEFSKWNRKVCNASHIQWDITNAIKWRYAEDE